jgi:hypothetical protein
MYRVLWWLLTPHPSFGRSLAIYHKHLTGKRRKRSHIQRCALVCRSCTEEGNRKAYIATASVKVDKSLLALLQANLWARGDALNVISSIPMDRYGVNTAGSTALAIKVRNKPS